MNVELYYFDRCPSYLRALENAREALRLEGLHEDVALIAVKSDADAQAKRLIGSPTIRINGLDLEGPEAEDNSYGFGCRIYADNGSSAGWPSVEKVSQALRRQAEIGR
jgi:hypothetical protein